ncbi:recombinase family protein [Xenorhabdus nematophila]|uniref:recombinase family protein n=1 Tax=Xenorhabdus nematophila TaxID=628 RepID=UPI00032755D8|nr:recombinase family protein [Xenorhabdus nematophila]CCW28970.1 Protein uvp1 [Xenorhabdus nematophila F1]
MRIGYARKSTAEQDLSHQVDALHEADCEQVYQEQVSRGGERRRKEGTPELDNCLRALRKGDTLVVWALDRLGGNLRDLVNLMEDLQLREINFESLKENIDTSSFAGELYLQLIAIFSNFEHNRNRERTLSGLVSARARGRIGGRPSSLSADQIKEIDVLVASQAFTIGDIARRYSVSRQTIYNRHRRKKPAQ